MLLMVLSQILKNPVNKNPAKVRNDDREFPKRINFKGVKFPVHKKSY